MSTSEVADLLQLHVNTVRPHLDRMREAGLLRMDTGARGGVGRPQHRYSLAEDAPALGLEPSPFPTLARMLLNAAAEAGLDRSEMLGAGREQGRADASLWPEGADPLEALIVEQAKFGFDPDVDESDRSATIAFGNCPYHELASSHPDIVCGLHCGLIEGLLDGLGRKDARIDPEGTGEGVGAPRRRCRVVRFHAVVDRDPCRVELTIR